MKPDFDKLEKLANRPAKLNRSTPILIRARCSGCGEVPSGIDFFGEPYTFKNVYRIRSYGPRSRITSYYYDYEGTRYYRKNLYAHPVDYKGYNPRMHNHTRQKFDHTASNNVYVYCKCSNWVIEKIAGFDRPEISNRKTSVLSKQNR